MNKEEFLQQLRLELHGLPQEDIDSHAAFYGEMIDDRIEDGFSEEEAVSGIGTPESVAAQIVEETPLPRIIRERVRPKRPLRALEIILLVLGSPVWLSLALALFAVVLSVYIVLWAMIIVLWTVFVSFIAAGLASLAAGVIGLVRGDRPAGLALLGCALVLLGLSIILFFAAKGATKGAAVLTKSIARGFKSLFVRKEKTA